jgi:hypothetical protein
VSTRAKIALSLAVAVIACAGLAQVAVATHPRPKGATPLRASVVPAYKACGAPNRTHGAPLAFPSCNPPVQASGFLTVGTPDANGVAAANSVGFVRLDAKVGVPGPPDDSDLLVKASISDVRCKPATAAAVCSGTNAADGPDYSGELQGNATIRISDHYNGPSLTEAATVQDIPLPVNATCANTTDTGTGGVCTINTSANAVALGAVKDGERALVEIGQISVNDGGPDGQASTADNTTFAIQGIFIP